VKPAFENERLGEKWQGPYLKPGTKMDDAWGFKIRYELLDSSQKTEASAPDYKLYSVGPDGQPDTDDDVKLTDESEATKDSKTVLEP
jgi:hypothetical protein